jgi:putative methyltransferase (TIGR04325 family)
MKFRDFVPPVLIPAIRGLRTRMGSRVYSSYAEALADCTVDGYENNAIVDVVVEKTVRYRNELLASKAPLQIDATSAYTVCSILASIGSSRQIKVLDFGGAAGAHYFLVRSILPSSFELSWIVVETPAMVEKAEALLSNEELHFSDNLDHAANQLGRIDLLHTSGALQCVDSPYEYLRTLVGLSAEFIALNRLGLTRGGHDVITVHQSWLSWNGPGPLPEDFVDAKVAYPFVFMRETTLMNVVQENYRALACFEDASGIFPVNNEPILGMSLLMRRR